MKGRAHEFFFTPRIIVNVIGNGSYGGENVLVATDTAAFFEAGVLVVRTDGRKVFFPWSQVIQVMEAPE